MDESSRIQKMTKKNNGVGYSATWFRDMPGDYDIGKDSKPPDR